jgi:hypothetical protein
VALRMAFYRRLDDSPLLGSQLAGSVVPWILDAVACPARCHHALLERRERAGLKVAAPNAPRAVDLGGGWASVERGQALEKVRDDHLGSLSVDLVALAKCAAEQFLLRAGAPGKGRNHSGQHNKESRPAAEGEGFADSKQYEAEVDGVPHEVIGAGCDETCLPICLGHEAPSRTKLCAGSENEGGARDRQK